MEDKGSSRQSHKRPKGRVRKHELGVSDNNLVKQDESPNNTSNSEDATVTITKKNVKRKRNEPNSRRKQRTTPYPKTVRRRSTLPAKSPEAGDKASGEKATLQSTPRTLASPGGRQPVVTVSEALVNLLSAVKVLFKQVSLLDPGTNDEREGPYI